MSDIVVRRSSDRPSPPPARALSSLGMGGRPGQLYVCVENPGPHVARNVVVEARIVPNLGTPLDYPADWTTVDGTHLKPHTAHGVFPTIPAGASVIARLEISADDTDRMAGWLRTLHARPTLLAMALSGNDLSCHAITWGATVVTVELTSRDLR